MKNLIKDKSGLMWIWGVAAIALVLGAVIYFPLSYAWNAVYTEVVGDYVFTGTTALGINVIVFIVSYLMSFIVIAVINWMLVQSKVEGTYQ